MKTYTLCLAVCGMFLAGCGGSGNSTAERSTKMDSTAPAPGPLSNADSQLMAQPVPPIPPMPNMPAPKPTGWKAFDDYYEQLDNVLGLEVKSEGHIATDELQALQQRAEALAKDTDPAGSTTVTQRQALLQQVRQIVNLPDSGAAVTERVRGLHPVVETTRMIVELAGKGETGPYIQRLQFIHGQIEGVVMRLQREEIARRQKK